MTKQAKNMLASENKNETANTAIDNRDMDLTLGKHKSLRDIARAGEAQRMDRQVQVMDLANKGYASNAIAHLLGIKQYEVERDIADVLKDVADRRADLGSAYRIALVRELESQVMLLDEFIESAKGYLQKEHILASEYIGKHVLRIAQILGYTLPEKTQKEQIINVTQVVVNGNIPAPNIDRTSNTRRQDDPESFNTITYPPEHAI